VKVFTSGNRKGSPLPREGIGETANRRNARLGGDVGKLPCHRTLGLLSEPTKLSSQFGVVAKLGAEPLNKLLSAGKFSCCKGRPHRSATRESPLGIGCWKHLGDFLF